MNKEQTNPELEFEDNSRKRIIIILVSIIAFIGISSFTYFKKEEAKDFVCLNGQTEIYDKYKTAVVLVKHEYAFEVSIKGNKPFMLSPETNQILGLVENSITGTGFFVSNDGKIITNKHVAQPWFYENDKFEELDFEYAIELIASSIPETTDPSEYKNLLEENAYEYYIESNKYHEDLDDEVSETQSEKKIDSTDTNENSKANDSISISNNLEDNSDTSIKYISSEDIVITPKTISISIALHNSKDEWIDCKTLSISEDPEIDIAVLQIDGETLPSKVENYIDLNTAITDDEELKPGTKAILIGYPMGMALANTRKGIKVQVYEGQINKESDGVSLQYNVTSTNGASGSPVFDDCGRFIAVNYAGFEVAQGYNFGIVAKHAIDLLD
jgi:S1-C subfamily serine protease